MNRISAFAAALAALSLASPVLAQPTFQGWERAPNAQQILRYYPQEARDAGVGGRVELQCRVGPMGELADCSILSETPAGYGFGEAAQKLVTASGMKMRRNGMSSGGMVVLPMVFEPERSRRAPDAPAGPVA